MPDEPCASCGERPRLANLRRCKRCLKNDADASCPPKPARAKKARKARKPKDYGCTHCHGRFPPERMAKRNDRQVRVCQSCESAALERKRVQKLAREEARQLDASARKTRRRLQWCGQVARYRQRHPERHAARERVRYAIRTGKIKPKRRCEAIGCRRPTASRHHNDYSQPLIVAFVCNKHHEHAHHIAPVPLKPSALVRFARAPEQSAA